MELFVWLVMGITFGYASSIAAGLRNRNTLLWYWCGFITSIVAFVIITRLPRKDHP